MTPHETAHVQNPSRKTAALVLWQIDTVYACGGIEVDEAGFVRNAAPIFRWMIGKHLAEVRRWLQDKRGKLTQCGGM